MPGRRSLAALLADRSGGAILEFAFVGPVLITLVLGAMDVGRMFYVRTSLEYATEQAAHYYMANPTTTTSDVTSHLKGWMPGGSSGMGGSVNVSYADTTNCNGNTAVTCTTITATYSFSFIAQYLGLGTKTLGARAEAVRYGS